MNPASRLVHRRLQSPSTVAIPRWFKPRWFKPRWSKPRWSRPCWFKPCWFKPGALGFLGFAFLLSALPGFGQGSGGHDVSQVPREIQGCLSRSGDTYTLETETGVVYQLRGDHSLISAHAGQEVDATGTEVVTTPSNVPARSNPQADANRTADSESIAPPAFVVSKLVELKNKCYASR